MTQVCVRVGQPVVFVVHIVGDVLEVLHVRLDEELPEQREVRVLRVVDLHLAPRVLPDPDFLAGFL